MKIKTLITKASLFVLGAALASTGARAQLPATLTDLGATAPIPGPNDQSQLLFRTSGPLNFGGLNYYWDAGTPPGQTFTTGNNPGGYIMNTVDVKTGGGGGGGFSTLQPYRLRIYSVAGVNSNSASLMAFFQSQGFSFTTESDWLEMSGLNLALAPNTTYAYTFGRSTSGYENLATTNGNAYPAGLACAIPANGGTLTYSTVLDADATFNVGLTLPTTLTVNPPTSSSPNPVAVGTTVTLTAGVVVGNTGAYTYQWLTDGGGGGSLTNIPGATSATLSINTTGKNLGGYQYATKVTDSTLAVVTSATLLLDVSQTISGTFADLGTTPPTVGSADAAQLTSALTYQNSGGLNYYTDNGTPPGQTFTTGSNGKGYALGAVAIRLVGGGSAGTTTAQGYDLFLFQISADGSSANLMADVTNLNVTFVYGDWIQWTFPSVTLNPNSVYAYTLHRRTTGYAGLSTSPGGDAYPGGQMASIPSAGGPVTYANTTGLDGTFVAGMIPLGVAIILNLPTATPNPAYALSPVKLADNASTPGVFTYKWLTDDGTGALPPNYVVIPGATATNLTVVPKDLTPGGGDYTTNYYFVATDTLGNSATSSVVTLTVHPASAPQFTVTPTPTNRVAFVGNSTRYTATEIGTLPITNQWQLNNGGGFVNLAGQTNTTLLLNNLQLTDSGTYQLTATNLVGTTNAAVTLTVIPDPAAPAVGNIFSYMVATNHPWAYWRLNETGDPTALNAPTYTAYDYTGHGFDATYGSAVTVSNAGPEAPAYPGFETTNLAAGTTLGLPGAFLSVPALNLTGNTNLTFMAWINPNGPQAGAAGLLFNRGGPDTACGFGFGNTQDHLGYTWNNNAQATWSWESGLVVQEGQWNFVAYVITPTNAAVYLGYVVSGTSTNFLQANNPIAHIAETFNGGTVLLGSDNSSLGRTFGGLIDEATLFTNALSTAQVQQYFLAAIGASALAPTVAPAAALPAAEVYSGQNVRLTASTSGTAPLTNQWQVSSDNITWANVPGATADSLLISPQTVGTAYYQLISKNVAGSNSSGSVTVTFDALPSYPPGLWTASFQPTNNLDGAQNTGGGIGHYVGRGIVGNGMYWNILPHVLSAGGGYAANNIVSVSDLLDDGATHSGIYCHMNNGGSYNGLGGSLPYSTDIGNLVDQWYRTYFSDAANGNGALQFFGVPAGIYNLVCYAGSGMTRNGSGDLGTTFVVYDPVNGNQTGSTLAPILTPALSEGVNFVTFTNVHIAGTLNVEVQANPNAAGSSAAVSGAQLQLVSYDVAAPPVTLNQTYSAANHTLTLNWTQGILQTTTNLLGPWTPIYTPSPITVTTTNGMQFYRVRVE